MPVLQDGELILYGFVGDNFWDDGFTASDVMAALAEVGRETDITVRINSGGGYVDDGIAIYNALAAHKGKVRVEVDAMAASAASLIAMAGDTIVMRTGSMMMIHDPARITWGTAEDHARSVDILDKQAAMMAGIYADRSGNDADKAREAMKAETWMTAEEAVEAGYADEAEGAKTKAYAAFDYRIYANAPSSLKALASRRKWDLPASDGRMAASAGRPSPKKGATAMEEDEEKKTPLESVQAAWAGASDEDKSAIRTWLAEQDGAPDEDEEDDAGSDVEASIRAERARAADISAACKLAGKPEKATAFIQSGTALSEVLASLGAERTGGENTNPRRGADPSTPGASPSVSMAKAIEKVNARDRGLNPKGD